MKKYLNEELIKILLSIILLVISFFISNENIKLILLILSYIIISFEMNAMVDEKSKTILERAALTCPVYLSLHPDIRKTIHFNWK